MKYQKKSGGRLFARLIALGILLGMIVTAVLPAIPTSAVGGQRMTTEEVSSAADTLPTSQVAPSQLLAAIIGETVSAAEGQWLDLDAAEILPAELFLTYDSAVPHTAVSMAAISGGIVEITAQTYTGEICATVWTPSEVTVDGKTYPMSPVGDGAYVAQIPADEDAVSCRVRYETLLTVSQEAANLLCTAAYQRAEKLSATLDAYEQAVKNHADATEAYDAYRAELQSYRTALAEYNAYQEALRAYESRLAAYEAYLAEKEVYEQQLVLYEAYLSEKAAYEEALAEYTDFVNNPAAYEQKYLAYCAYLSELEKVSAQLTLLDSCFISDAAGHILNNTLNGPTVKTVVDRQDELVSAGCDAKDIANADQATKRLIALLKDYPVKGEDAERYAYYIRHYAEIRDNVTLLYTSLSRLYGNDGVADILDMQGKKERYWQFVAQLYCLSAAMDDTVALNMEWSISGKKMTELLDACFILKDTNAATPMTAYPAYMEEVLPPSQMKKPVQPAVVEKPMPPLKVTEPQKPATVSKPIMPPVVSAPGRYPDRPLFSMYEEALVNAFVTEAWTKREGVLGDVSYPLALSVDQYLLLQDTKTAYFYDSNRMTLLAVQTADAEGFVSWPSDPQAPELNDGMVYTFSGWVDEAGHAYLPQDGGITITESKTFYAVYTSTKASYTVTWDVDGTLTDETYDYGEIPVYQGTPTKSDADGNEYTFVGWTPVVRPVTDHVTYTAVFSSQQMFYEIQWVIGDRIETEIYPAGEIPVYPSVPTLPMDGRNTYTFSHWSPAVTTVDGNAVYTAVFEAVDLLDGETNAALTETADMICITLQDGAGELSLNIRHLLAYAAERSCGLLLTRGSTALMLSEEAVAVLREGETERMSLSDASGGRPLVLRFYDAASKEISPDVTAKITLGLPQKQIGRICDESGELVSSVKEGVMTAVLQAGECYTLQTGYAVTLHMAVQGSDDETGGICVLSSDIAREGEIVSVRIQASPGYAMSSVVIRDSYGGVIPHTVMPDGQYSFTMPAGNAEITVEMQPCFYTVTFRVGDTVISNERYRYGDMPVIPADPTRADDGQYRYSFIGWTPTVTAVMGDAVYEAEFLQISLDEAAGVEESEWGLLQLALMGALVAVAVCAAILVPYIVIQKKRGTALENSQADETEEAP